MLKCGLCAVVLAVFVTPAIASNKFYVVRDNTTKECSIVGQKPTSAGMKVIGPAHKTQAMAEKTIKAAKACDPR